MRKFNYKAKDEAGKIIYSRIEADSKAEAIEKISQIGYYPVYIEDSAKADKLISYMNRVLITTQIP